MKTMVTWGSFNFLIKFIFIISSLATLYNVHICIPCREAPYAGRGGYRGRGLGRGRGSYRGGYHHEGHRPVSDEEWRRPATEEYEARPSRHAIPREPAADRSRSRSRSPRRRSPDSDSDSSSRRNGALSAARTLTDVARKCLTIWNGALILKSSLFPAKFHLTDGDSDIVEQLMKDEDGKPHLRITQRLRLDQSKLEDVQKRISTSSSHAIFLGLAGSTTAIQLDEASAQNPDATGTLLELRAYGANDYLFIHFSLKIVSSFFSFIRNSSPTSKFSVIFEAKRSSWRHFTVKQRN